MLIEGTTMSNLSGPSSLTARKASFSQARSASPIERCTKVFVAPRAPESSTGTRKQLGHELLRLPLGRRHLGRLARIVELPQITKLLLQCIRPGRQIGPPRAARGLRIGRDHLHPRLHQVSPVLISLGLPLRTRMTIVDV